MASKQLKDESLLDTNVSSRQVLRQGFQGCIRDLRILTAVTPEEVWTPVDWASAIERDSALPHWEGCPLDLQNGIHFLGDGEKTKCQICIILV